MKRYKHILFDLDHTLWDFDGNCSDTLMDLIPKFGLDKYIHTNPAEFINTYKAINHKMWNDYHKGYIDKAALRKNRFEKTFEMFGINRPELALEMNQAFLQLCPTKKGLLPFAVEVLEYLKPRYFLHILTNGFKETQDIKLASAGITSYFTHVFHCESAGYLKPDPKIFDYTVAALQSSHHDCLMIGDDLDADILGAKNVGIDHVFYNRVGHVHEEQLTYEIKCLSELLHLL